MTSAAHLPTDIWRIADVEVRCLQSAAAGPSADVAKGDMAKVRRLVETSSGPVLLCFFRRLG
jgi:hypothetical protein